MISYGMPRRAKRNGGADLFNGCCAGVTLGSRRCSLKNYVFNRINSESERPRTSSRLWVCTASVETQASKSRGKFPKGSLQPPPAVM